MKHLLSTRHSQLLVSVCLAATILPVIEAEPRCPGNIVSLTPRFVQQAFIVIPVKVNLAGPFDFTVDTGSQVTVIDPLLAAELKPQTSRQVGLVSVASFAQASIAVLDTLEADSKIWLSKPLVSSRETRVLVDSRQPY
jgi:Aspartyl protease